MEEEEELEHGSRLYSSLTDPQDVPRKGYFFEHDDRDAPPSETRRPTSMPQRRFGEIRPPPASDSAPPWRERDWRDRDREREPSHKRYSSDDKPAYRESRGERRESRGEGQERRESRGEGQDRRESRGEWQDRHRDDSYQRERREFRERRPRSPARWRHDKFEEEAEGNEMETENPEGKEVKSVVQSAKRIDDMWAHDKYEELVDLDDTEITPQEPELLQQKV